jgi:hypothetical protein
MQQFVLPAKNPEARERIAGNLSRFLSQLPPEQAWSVEVKRHAKRRSDQQNRYLWGVAYPAFLRALPGWEAEDVHEYLLGEHFGWERLEGLGRPRVKPVKRSSKLSTLEFAEYVDFVQRKAAELGLYVPDPEPA